MIVSELVRSLFPSSLLSPAFSDALRKLDDIAVAPSLAIREPLARLVVSNPTLLQRNFSRHSIGELATSMTLRGVASSLKPTGLRNQLLEHSDDEFRHSKMFRALADALSNSTGCREYDDYQYILDEDRRFLANYTGDVVEFICDLFSGEVRTYSFLSGYVTGLSVNESSHAEKSCRILRQVLNDERRHVAYTAHYIDEWMGNGLDLSTSLARGFRGFDRISWEDVAETATFFSHRSLSDRRNS